MEAKGFKKVPPIEPFELSIGLEDLLRFWDPSWRDKAWHYQMIGVDTLLRSERDGAIAETGLRAEARNNNLKFGYAYGRKIKMRSIAGVKYIMEMILGPIALAALAVPVMPFLVKTFHPTLENIWDPNFWLIIFLSLAIVSPLIIPYIIFYAYIKPKRILTEINQRIVEIAESMGGKQITPFKRKTITLED